MAGVEAVTAAAAAVDTCARSDGPGGADGEQGGEEEHSLG